MAGHTSSMVFIQYLTTVFDNIQDAVLFVGVGPKHSYRLLMANHAFSTYTGHGPDDVGKDIRDVVTPSTYEALIKKYDEVVKTKKPMEYTETYTVPIGRQTYNVKLIPVANAVGEVVQIAVITRNVTELHELRDLAKASAETLEQLARDLREA